MNKTIKKILAAALAGTVLILSGCTSSGFDNTNLLRPPRTTGDKAQIQEIIEEKAGGDYTLKYPKDGSYRSAIINEDLDNDGIDEAIVFYKPSVDDEPVHILFIKNFGGTWQDIGDYSSGKTDVDKIEIGDLSGSGTNDVIVGWSDTAGSVCSLSAYIFEEKTTAELKVEDTYNQFMLADMTGDGKNSIMLFSLAAQNVDANVKMLQLDAESKTIFTRSSTAMSNSASSFLSLTFGNATKSQSGIFIDTLSVSHESETQFIYWDKNSSNLVNPLNTQNSNKISTNPTIRGSADVICTDINGDGIVEIPTLTLLPHNNAENSETIAFQSTWNTYNPSKNKLSPLMDTVTNLEKGYYFIIPEEWSGKVTARTSIYGNSITFYLWNFAESDDANEDTEQATGTQSSDSSKTGTLGDKLLTIQVFSAQDWINAKNDNYIEVGDYGDMVYTVNIPAETENTKGIAMSLNKIPDYFKLTNK